MLKLWTSQVELNPAVVVMCLWASHADLIVS